MIILYTFDAPEVDRLTKLTMLRISIYTSIRELNSLISLIYIYSNNPTELKKELNLSDCRVVFSKIPKHVVAVISSTRLNDDIKYLDFNPDINSHYRIINGNIGTAHSRVFLFYKLLKKHKKNILYLDYDTGIKRNAGSDLSEKLVTSNVITDLKTSDSIPSNILNIYPLLQISKMPKYISSYAVRWCCAYLYVSYSSENLKLCNDIEKIYKKLLVDLGFMDSHDEYAVGLALKKHDIYPENLYINNTFFTTKSNVLLHTDFGETPAIVHYSHQKDSPDYSVRMKDWISNWQRYFNCGGEEPNIPSIDYSALTSNDYIGGRFETL